MTEGLREFDDRIGRCCYCRLLVFSDDNWCLSRPTSSEFLAHTKCDAEERIKSSYI